MRTGVAVVNAAVGRASHLRPLVNDTTDGAYASVVFLTPRDLPVSGTYPAILVSILPMPDRMT